MLVHDLFLAKEWFHAHRHFHISPDWTEFRKIRTAYLTPDRWYHTWEHIYATCRFVNRHYDSQPLVILALFYHDVVYDVTRKDKEQASARVWEEYARRRNLVESNPDDVKTISDLIFMTEKHRVDEDSPASFAIMCDADMSIFVADQPSYQRYARNIWREYQSFGREKFVAGRLQFLKTVDPETLFYTTQAKRLLGQAQTNLDWERTTLEKTPDLIVGSLDTIKSK